MHPLGDPALALLAPRQMHVEVLVVTRLSTEDLEAKAIVKWD